LTLQCKDKTLRQRLLAARYWYRAVVRLAAVLSRKVSD
jgi:hypothetical protein